MVVYILLWGMLHTIYFYNSKCMAFCKNLLPRQAGILVIALQKGSSSTSHESAWEVCMWLHCSLRTVCFGSLCRLLGRAGISLISCYHIHKHTCHQYLTPIRHTNLHTHTHSFYTSVLKMEKKTSIHPYTHLCKYTYCGFIGWWLSCKHK